jgi:hypothetical protein
MPNQKDSSEGKNIPGHAWYKETIGDPESESQQTKRPEQAQMKGTPNKLEQASSKPAADKSFLSSSPSQTIVLLLICIVFITAICMGYKIIVKSGDKHLELVPPQKPPAATSPAAKP